MNNKSPTSISGGMDRGIHGVVLAFVSHGNIILVITLTPYNRIVIIVEIMVQLVLYVCLWTLFETFCYVSL